MGLKGLSPGWWEKTGHSFFVVGKETTRKTFGRRARSRLSCNDVAGLSAIRLAIIWHRRDLNHIDTCFDGQGVSLNHRPRTSPHHLVLTHICKESWPRLVNSS